MSSRIVRYFKFMVNADTLGDEENHDEDKKSGAGVGVLAFHENPRDTEIHTEERKDSEKEGAVNHRFLFLYASYCLFHGARFGASER